MMRRVLLVVLEMPILQPGLNQTAGVFGGTLTATAIPEPLTILGTFLAGGIGVGMKRKKQQLEKETC